MDKLDELTPEARMYVYGKALVTNIDQIKKSIEEGFGTNPPSQINEFSHARKLADASNKFVSVNNDTLYSNAQIDISGGPIIFTIPKIKNRYYVFQFIDVWTNNFAYVGQRTIGEEGATCILVPPKYNGPLLDNESKNCIVLECPTHLVSIVGRIACSGPEDISNVSDIQNCLEIKKTNDGKTIGLPNLEVYDFENLLFWNKLRTYYKDFPSSKTFKSLFKEAEVLLGINNNFNNLEFFGQMSEYQKKRLIAGEIEGMNFINHQLKKSQNIQNGWQINLHMFDYNNDYLGFGTDKNNRWIIANANAKTSIKKAAVMRSLAAVGGLWGNQAYEAVYFPVYIDSNGEVLNGEYKYKLHFKKLPPTNAFWSITMYDGEDYFLVPNEINRYSIGDRTKGVIYNKDGSLTIMISSKRPEDVSNWLPAPSKNFRPLLRAYLPKEEILNGDYIPPCIEKIIKDN